jgi:hypothetical protein
MQALAVAGATLFATLVWGVGTFAAGASVMDEITDRTWDQQRMSAMQPWAMTWGKLAGATAYGWYGGALCLLVAVPSALLGGVYAGVLKLTLAGLLGGVCLQALVIAVNLQLVKAGGKQARRNALWAPVLVLLWGLGPLMGILQGENVLWWNQSVDKLDFALASLLLCACCTLAAAWRSMAEVLAVRQFPWGWPGLALLATTYMTGFAPAEKMGFFGVAGLCTCAALTYFALLAEPQQRPLWQRVVSRVVAQQWRAAWLQLPRWPTTLLLALPFAIVVTTSLGEHSALPWNLEKHIALQPVAFVLLMARDCLLALFFAFSPNGRRSGLAFTVAMVLLYGLLPWLLGAAGLQALLGFAQPLLAASSLSLLFAAMHLAAALALLRWRWRATAQ